ncbi:unnamed protein product [Bursaphelenchus okinawaensis]|uniref:Nuclear receptor domain-containing protein n=1 Tax=Bursaphelenchus okinawaensis TaxID=465554 RepID=A0A811JQ43_9BILA|nr:unnamed protein product [Bursaphelenchus okinawaensis]CAG9077615.1 unnamed protein product [Bursaphelenchus okinawaensis]
MSVGSSVSPSLSSCSSNGDRMSPSEIPLLHVDEEELGIQPLVDKVPCQICKLQASAVTYFGVPVCSGCRAFFRRSVKSNKKYHCLNSRLCGKNQLVPNRRVCKYCRFQRCIDAGMLDAKVRMTTRLMESTKNFDCPLPFLVTSPTSTVYLTNDDVLSRFMTLKQRIISERNRLYGHRFEAQLSSGAPHDMKVGLDEYAIFNRVINSTDNLFNQIDVEDWERLKSSEYSMWWSLTEQLATTIRYYGHEHKRLYNIDGSYAPLTMEHTRRHFGYIYSNIEGDKDNIFDITMEYVFRVQLAMAETVAKSMAKINLDDTELSALVLLLMTRSSCLENVKENTRKYLKFLRDGTLKSLANYEKSHGRDEDERMAQIIFLMTDFQNLGRLIKHSMQLLMAATEYRALPQHFYRILDECRHSSFIKPKAVFAC